MKRAYVVVSAADASGEQHIEFRGATARLMPGPRGALQRCGSEDSTTAVSNGSSGSSRLVLTTSFRETF